MTESASIEPKIKRKSFRFATCLKWTGERSGELSAEGKPALRVGSPPEFKGEPGVWSPEDFYVAAVELCQMTTFIAFAARAELRLDSYESTAEGLLEFVDGGYQFTKVRIRPHVVVSDPDRLNEAEAMMHEAHDKCLIANSMKAEVVVEAEIESSPSD